MLYLAMTAAEFRNCRELPTKIAWMACHFSPYGTALSNLPRTLPEGSLLILNDRTPIHGHDPALICKLLTETVARLRCDAVLLDFQRPGCQEAAAVAKRLMELPCPVAVSEFYASDLPCPVFLPPVPLLTPLDAYLRPYEGRNIWLDTAPEGLSAVVTENGCTFSPVHGTDAADLPHYDNELLLHYRIDVTGSTAAFTLKRTRDDLTALLKKARSHGVTHAVGLYQEYSRDLSFLPP